MQRSTKWPDIDERALPLIHSALERLESAKGEVTVDFSSVHRLDPDGLRELARLAEEARARSVPVRLEGIHVEVYKVLKLIGLADKFAY